MFLTSVEGVGNGNDGNDGNDGTGNDGNDGNGDDGNGDGNGGNGNGGEKEGSGVGNLGSAEQYAYLLDRETAGRARDKEMIAELRVQRNAARAEAGRVKGVLEALASPLFAQYLEVVDAETVKQARSMGGAGVGVGGGKDAEVLLSTLLDHLDSAARNVAAAIASLNAEPTSSPTSPSTL